MELRFETPTAALVGLYNFLVAEGQTASPRGQATREILGVTYVIDEPWQVPITHEGRRARHLIGVVEALSLIGQTSVPEWLTRRVKAFDQFTDDGVFWGAYGPRIVGLPGEIVRLLNRDPQSRQAVMTYFDGHRDLGRDKKDLPCTVASQFFVRWGTLEHRIVMRSQDVWRGLTYDVVQFAALQGMVAAALDLPVGRAIFQVGSLHLYEEDAGYLEPSYLPEDDALATGRIMFAGRTVGEIGTWARSLLSGLEVRAATPFEEHCVTIMAEAERPSVARV